MDLYNAIFLTEINPILKVGSHKSLDFHDLPNLNYEFKSENILNLAQNSWNHGEKMDLHFIWKIFRVKLILSGLLKFIADIIGISSPYILKTIISAITTNPDNKTELLSWSALLFILQCLNSLAVNYYFLMVAEIGYKIRTIYSITIYRKTMKCFQEECNQDAGKILNMISSDVNRLESATIYVHYLWSGPLQAIIIVYFLWKLVGIASIIGLLIFIVFIPIQSRIVSKLASHRKKAFTFTDKRIKLLQELINGIRIVKLYLWENNFYDKIMKERDQEQNEILKSQLCRSLTVLITVIVPVFSSISTFIFYSLFGFRLHPDIVFPTLAYYNLLRYPLSLFPMVVSLVIDARISLNRILNFLLKKEIVDYSLSEKPNVSILSIMDGFFDWGYRSDSNEEPSLPSKNDSKDNLLSIKQQQDDNCTKCLRQINLSVNQGDLVLIIGAVGSGKSSLLKAIVGEMRSIKGIIRKSSSLGYCPQQAWIQNCTLRDNILFDSPFSKERYERVLQVCYLDRDISFMIDGDLTNIGENGANLSGGQKQRVSLARAAYSDNELIILDDPISSVDSKLAKDIFNNCIRGFLGSRTRIMTTNDTSILGYADKICLMDNLQIIEQGTYQEMTRNHTKFDHLFQSQNLEEKMEKDLKYLNSDETPFTSFSLSETNELTKQSNDIAIKHSKINIIEAEERNYGTISSGLYMDYIQFAGGLLILFSIMISLTFANLSRLGHDLWLTLWSMTPDLNFDIKVYILVYLFFGITQGIFVFINGVLFVYGAKNASMMINMKSLQNIINCPVSFFDQNLVGRIINRFSKDLDTIDNMLPEVLRSVFSMTFNCIFSILMICFASWRFVFPLIPLILIYIKIQHYYRCSSREIKRMEALSRSPLLSFYPETISGLPIIRSFHKIDKFLKMNLELLNQNNRLQYFIICIQRWVSVRIEMLGNFITFCTSISCVFGIVSPGMTGLALSYALSITSTLNWLVRQFAECEAQVISLERLSFYVNNLTDERIKNIDSKSPPDNWPSKGTVEFKNVCLKYHENSEVILKNISFKMESQERIAVIGRTGAGKSSLISALFRY